MVDNTETATEVFKDMYPKKMVESILGLSVDQLSNNVSYWQDEAQVACKELNDHTRADYARFIERVGMNIYPFIIAADHGKWNSGMGTTFSLFLPDGRIETVTPALHSTYGIYKAVTHVFLGLGVLLTPFMKSPKVTEWRKPLSAYKDKVTSTYDVLRRSPPSGTFHKRAVYKMLEDIISFMSECLNTSKINWQKWDKLNSDNFSRMMLSMDTAAQSQAEANVAALLKWKKLLGPALWRELYVVIPTVWAVNTHNPRQELFRHLLDEDRVDTHIILSEYPRSPQEARTLLGRVVGDRAIGRLVFGDQSQKKRLKTVALSTGVDALQDEAVKQIHRALLKHGCKPRKFTKSIDVDQKSETSRSCPFGSKL